MRTRKRVTSVAVLVAGPDGRFAAVESLGQDGRVDQITFPTACVGPGEAPEDTAARVVGEDLGGGALLVSRLRHLGTWAGEAGSYRAGYVAARWTRSDAPPRPPGRDGPVSLPVWANRADFLTLAVSSDPRWNALLLAAYDAWRRLPPPPVVEPEPGPPLTDEDVQLLRALGDGVGWVPVRHLLGYLLSWEEQDVLRVRDDLVARGLVEVRGRGRNRALRATPAGLALVS